MVKSSSPGTDIRTEILFFSFFFFLLFFFSPLFLFVIVVPAVVFSFVHSGT